MNLSTIILFALVLTLVQSAHVEPTSPTICLPDQETCIGIDCSSERSCFHGTCLSNGSCECDPCYSGATCDVPKNEHKPAFMKSEDTLRIYANIKGVLYQPHMEDDDYAEKCESSGRRTCLCGQNTFVVANRNDSKLFHIDNTTGQLTLMEHQSLETGRSYSLTLLLTDSSTGGNESTTIFGQLHLTITTEDQESEFEQFDRFVGSVNTSPGSLTRMKRETNAADKSKTGIEVKLLSESPGVLEPGNTLDFEVCIILPAMDAANAMDLNIEVFGHDMTSGKTTMALFGGKIISIGSTLRNKITSLQLEESDATLSYKYNADLPYVPDHLIMSLGEVYNEDTYVQDSADTSPSTIKMSFSATMIINADFLKADSPQIEILVGVEYADTEYIHISEGKIDYQEATVTSSQSYNMSLALTGPDEVPQYSGALVDITGPILTPFETIFVEFYNLGEEHDLYSISNVRMYRVGNHTKLIAIPADYEKTEYYSSVTGKTNIRVTYSFLIINSYISDPLVAGPEHEYRITASIFAYNAPVGSVIKVNANVKTVKVLWVASIELTVIDELSQTEGPPTSLVQRMMEGSSNLVAQAQSATWALRFGLTSAKTLIECSLTATDNEQLTGVAFGDAGPYVAMLPELETLVDYEAKSWKFTLNSTILPTDHTFNETLNFVDLLVTISYIDATSFGTAEVNCGSVGSSQLVPTAHPTPATVVVPTFNETSVIGTTSTIWFEGSVAGIYNRISTKGARTQFATFKSGVISDGAKINICEVRISNVGRGIHAMLKPQSQIEAPVNNDTMQYREETEIDLGTIGADLLETPDNSVYYFDVEIFMQLRKGQGFTLTDDFTVTSELTIDTVVSADTSTIVLSPVTTNPVYTAAKKPTVRVIPASTNINEIMTAQMLKVYIKTIPGTTLPYIVEVTNDGTQGIICEVVILNVGNNFACVDKHPHGKNDDPRQPITITPNEADFSSSVLNLGLLTNHGSSASIFSEAIADANTIEVGIIGRQNPDEMTSFAMKVTVSSLSFAEIQSITFNVSDPVTPKTGSSLGFPDVAAGLPVYDSSATPTNITIEVPAAFQKKVVITITNAGTADDIDLCAFMLVFVGLNMPCTKVKNVEPATVEDGSSKTITLDLGTLCHAPLSEKPEDNTIIVQVIPKLKIGKTSAALSLEILEDDASAIKQDITFNSQGPLPNVTFTRAQYEMTPAQSYDVKPGDRIWVGVTVKTEGKITIPMELGVLTNATDGHAEATVHDFRFGSVFGKNLACFDLIETYEKTLSTNYTNDGIPLAHESQHNMLSVDLRTITNHGLSYYMQTNVPEDDVFSIEAEIMIADHELLADGAIFNAYFCLKLGDDVYMVTPMKLTMRRTETYSPSILSEFTLDPIPTGAFQQNSQIRVKAKLWHDMSLSRVEIHDATVRVCFPKDIVLVESTDPSYTASLIEDTYTTNMTADLTKSVCNDFDIKYLFFTDAFELNLSVTVDPYLKMLKGLGLLKRTALLKLIGRESSSQGTLKYQMKTAFVNYDVQGTDCQEDLEIVNFPACQFSATTAIDETVAPQKAAKVEAKGWSPAVVPTGNWIHSITIDFLRQTRITKIAFTPITGERSVATYKLQWSSNGVDFADVCATNLEATTSELPFACKFVSRYARLVIVTTSDADETKAIGVQFKWYGCYIETIAATCADPAPTTLYTNNAQVWRHALYDSAISRLYVCDFNPIQNGLQCYSSDESTITLAPSYIKGLAGYSVLTQLVYAYSSNTTILVSSEDGIHWSPVNDADKPISYDSLPEAIPGQPESSFIPVDVGGSWQATFYGMSSNSVLKINWGS